MLDPSILRRAAAPVVALALAWPCAVRAEAAAPAPADTAVVPLREVVVTGTRVPESVLRAPAAISVVERRRFDDRRGISLKDALDLVPGVFTQSRGGAQDVRITIRGFGARGNGERSNSGNMRGIRVMMDGIPVTEPDGRTSLDLVNVGAADRIEVARSNSSTLYGNASGGVVHLRTRMDFDRPFAELRERVGAYGFHREQATVGMPLGAGAALLTLVQSDFDGWREHSQSSTTQVQGRMRVPLDGRTQLGLLADFSSNLNRFPGPLTAADLAADPTQANARFVTRDERRFNRVGRVAMTLDRTLARGHDLALTAFAEPKVLQRSERNRFRDFNRYHVGGSAALTLRSSPAADVSMTTTLGADDAFQDGSILFYTVGPGGTRGTDLRANKREAASTAGAFAQHEVRWRERWALTGALRFDLVWYVAEDRIEPHLNAEKTFRRVTPKGSLAYRTDAHTIYAALGGGVEAPAFNEIDPPAPFDTTTGLNPFLDAMRSTTYELGAKGELADLGPFGRLQYDLALYAIEIANDIVPWDGGAYFFTAGESHRRGVELGLGWQPIERLQLQGALTVSENEYDRYVNELGEFSGRRVAGLPGATFSGAARYRTLGGIGAELGVRSASGYFADDANTAATAPYTVLDATLSYARGFGAWSVRGYVAAHNLADERHVESVFINGVNGEYYEPGLPRNWSAGVTLALR